MDLTEIKLRVESIKAPWNSEYGRSRPEDLSPIGHLIAIDIPKLISEVERLGGGN